MKKSKTKNKIIPFFKYLAFVLVVITLIDLGLFKFINVLPGEYFIVLTILQALIALVLILLLLSKGSRRRILGAFLSLFYIVALVLVIVYELNTIDFLKRLGFVNYKTENYLLLVLNDSKYQKLGDLDKQKIGSLEFNSEGLKDARAKINNKITPQYMTYEDVFYLKDALLNKEIEAMLLEESLYTILVEDNEELSTKLRTIHDLEIDIETEDIAKNVDITNTSFNLYISGIDTYGKVSSVSRSDVNMLITINPNTHQILITSIPRDYYVELANRGKDKLTHAGIYGIDVSVKAIEDLLETKINYYVKVNFTSVIKVVDALGGVKVYSDYDFTSQDGYHYQKGYNEVDGKKALSFVRERKSFQGGDRVRVLNQAYMIEAMLDKAISPSIITKYNKLLDVLGNAFITNMDMQDITKFIKMQIDQMPDWQVVNYSLDGKDAMNYTYSYPRQKLYVMVPDEETITNAKLKIKEVLN